MKKKQIMLLLLVLFIGVPTLWAQSKKEKEALKKVAVRERIESGNYKIDVNFALPMSGRSVSLTSPYSLEIRNDSVISYLPYFGRAYSVPYGGGNGLDFKTLIKEYTMSINKKGKAEIKLKARNPEDLYEYKVTVFDNGAASIDVSMQNRQSISFSGDLYIPEKD